jgi:hypothetical protein
LNDITRDVRKSKRLSARQKAFLAKYITFIEKGHTITDARIKAYKIAYDKKNVPRESLRLNSWWVLNAVTKKQEVIDILARYGLDINRFAVELDKLLDAKKGVYHGGKRIAEEPDNRTRVTALSLFGDVLGIKNKSEVNINIDRSQSLIVEVMPEDIAKQKVKEIDTKDYTVLEEEIKQKLLATDGS